MLVALDESQSKPYDIRIRIICGLLILPHMLQRSLCAYHIVKFAPLSKDRRSVIGGRPRHMSCGERQERSAPTRAI